MADKALPMMRWEEERWMTHTKRNAGSKGPSTHLGLHGPTSHRVPDADVLTCKGLTGLRGEAWGAALPAVAGL